MTELEKQIRDYLILAKTPAELAAKTTALEKIIATQKKAILANLNPAKSVDEKKVTKKYQKWLRKLDP